MIIPLVCILKCWRSTLRNQTGMRAHVQFHVQAVIITFNVVILSCFVLLFVWFLFLFVCLFVFLQRTARHCSKVRAARAAQFPVLARPINLLITGVVISDLVVDPNTHSYHICYITVRMLTTGTRFLTSWCSYPRDFFNEKYKIGWKKTFSAAVHGCRYHLLLLSFV